MRKLMLTMVAVAAVASAAPAAHADTVVGANNGTAGSVLVEAERNIPAVSTAGPVRLVADCSFAGALTPANTLIVAYGGAATARGPQNNATPLATAIGCEINNGDVSQYKDVVLSGAQSAVGDSTLLATSGPKEWAVKPITVCVSAFSVFGPFPVSIASIDRTCKTPDGE